MKGRERGAQDQKFRLCVNSYSEGAWTGRLYKPGWEADGWDVPSETRFLTLTEELLDREGPELGAGERTRGGLPVVALEQGKGEVATFVIHVLSRQQSSWQGSVTWLEGKEARSFRSALELVFLLDSALSGGRAATGRMRSIWHNMA